MTDDGETRIPTVVVTGFLGSGKTTLIRSLLSDPRVGDVAVIVNEFGQVGIDHHLMRKTDERTILVRDGCLCCGMRSDLADALRELLSKRSRDARSWFDRVVVETTGLADPVPIIQTVVAEPMVRHHYRVERVVTTVDAVNGAHNISSYGEALRQVAAADTVVVTKQDLVAEGVVEALRALLGRINPTATLIDAPVGRQDVDALFGQVPIGNELWDADPTRHEENDERAVVPTLHGAGGRIASRSILLDHALDWPMFGIWLTMLLHRHGDRVLRVKGLLNVGEASGPMLLDGVQHVIHAPRHLSRWPDEDRRGRLVFIVRDLDLDRIESSLAVFQAAAARASRR